MNYFENITLSNINKYLIFLKKNPDITCFYIGIFLLPSAFSIACIFLLIPIFISIFKNHHKLLNDNWNKPFLISCFLLIFSSLYHFFLKDNTNLTNWDPSLSLIGLANWIPQIILYIALQPYLKTKKLRKNFCLILLSGTFPVLISGIGQLFFKWYGPMQTLNGLITWYQRPLPNFFAVTGLFNNPNYAGAWLNIAWPFALALIIKQKRTIVEKIFSIFFLLAIFIFIIFTGSRSAWISMIISVPLVFGSKSFKWFVPSLLSSLAFISSIVFPIFGKSVQIFLQAIIPKFFWVDLTSEGYVNLDTSRLEIWRTGINSIINNPLFGNGAASFTSIFNNETGLWKWHSHNLPIELAISYGIPSALIILLSITGLIFLGIRKIYLNSKLIMHPNLFEKAWLTSIIILILSQMVDIQYFDGRISLIGWLLLSGVKNLIKEDY